MADYDELIKESPNLTMRRISRWGRVVPLTLVFLGVISSCGSSVESVCSQAVSVPSFTIRFIQGLDNFSEDQYENLKNDAVQTRETLFRLLDIYPDSGDIGDVLAKIDTFVVAMEASQWDVSQALRNIDAVTAAVTLGSAETIAQANRVDAAVIGLCGLPATFLPNSDSEITLPMPWIPGPTDTEPDTNLVENESERFALGEMVGMLFQLTLTVEQIQCIGTELVKVVDKSDVTSNLAQYQGQFQKAFDTCEIDFSVPID
jgi:hypothetical protein